MVQTEIGNVVPLANTDLPMSPGPPIGMRVSPKSGLPTGMNSMEVASVYNADGRGGVLFADIDGDLDNGIAPLQFTLGASRVSAYWSADLAPCQTEIAPRLAIGVPILRS